MKKWFCLFILISINISTNATAARNWALEGALPRAKAQVLEIEGVNPSDWDDFLKHKQSTFDTRATKNEEGYTTWLVSEFDKWKSNTLLHEDKEGFGDDDTRREFDPSRASSVVSSPARSVPGGAGSGSVAGGSMISGTTLSTRVHGIAGSGIARVQACLQEMKDIRAALDLTKSESREGLRDRLEGTPDAVGPTFQELFNSDPLRASYIKVLLEDAKHRAEVLAAINAPANAVFRAALIQSLLGNTDIRKAVLDALHTSHSGEMIDAVHGGAHRAEMIAKLHGDGTRSEVINHLSTNHPDDMVAKVVELHRPAVITALIPAHTADFTPLLGTNGVFRDAMLDGLLAGHRDTLLTRLGMGTLTERINNLVLDTTNRPTIAQAFVDSVDFRNVLIARLEAGRHAINATRMLWHTIDEGGAAFWGALGNDVIVTKVAFDHLLAKTRDGYRAISDFTGQRGNFRAAFADRNLVGKDGTHIGSSKPR